MLLFDIKYSSFRDRKILGMEKMSFKHLALDRQLIEESIYGYEPRLQVEPSTDRLRYTVLFDGEPKALIILHFNKNGKTTIQVNQGENPVLGASVAQEIISQCQVAIASKQSFRIKPLTKESFGLWLACY